MPTYLSHFPSIMLNYNVLLMASHIFFVRWHTPHRLWVAPALTTSVLFLWVTSAVALSSVLELPSVRSRKEIVFSSKQPYRVWYYKLQELKPFFFLNFNSSNFQLQIIQILNAIYHCKRRAWTVSNDFIKCLDAMPITLQ